MLFELNRTLLHGTIFFPQWITGEGQHPKKPSAIRMTSLKICSASATMARITMKSLIRYLGRSLLTILMVRN
ncbi:MULTISPECIES: hypothetical protein [unclassified Pantoea]|uniref:hypothetical protein n=1 Tax=unclassified Pantoea TaxID=2630326 RepID=UPI00332E3275